MVSNHEIKKNKISAFGLWALVVLTFVGLLFIMFELVLTPAPADFTSAQILTPVVTPVDMPVIGFNTSGVVQMQAIVTARKSDECLSSTQYFLDLPDGRTWKLPGSRLTDKNRPITEVIYQTIVPYNSPVGEAYFYVFDTYGCGLHDEKVRSPKIRFEIKPSVNLMHRHVAFPDGS